MAHSEILDSLAGFGENGINTVVLQSGESDYLKPDWVSKLIERIKSETGLAVTLSLGEKTAGVYREWKDAGASRYLLKFETSNPGLYARLHPGRRNGWEQRIKAIKTLTEADYEVGSGNIVGLPGQSCEDLANDILLFRELNLDMIGIGPYVPHPSTPIALNRRKFDAPADQVAADSELTFKTLALARLICPLANIPATTALSTVDHTRVRELALNRGANVIMPDFTPERYKRLYDIYPKNAALTGDPVEIAGQIKNLLERTGRRIGTTNGVSLNFKRRNSQISRE